MTTLDDARAAALLDLTIAVAIGDGGHRGAALGAVIADALGTPLPDAHPAGVQSEDPLRIDLEGCLAAFDDAPEPDRNRVLAVLARAAGAGRVVDVAAHVLVAIAARRLGLASESTEFIVVPGGAGAQRRAA